MHRHCYWPTGKVEVVYVLQSTVYIDQRVSEVERLSERETKTEEANKKPYSDRENTLCWGSLSVRMEHLLLPTGSPS